jgi:hypothetical protein
MLALTLRGLVRYAQPAYAYCAACLQRLPHYVAEASWAAVSVHVPAIQLFVPACNRS